MVCTFTVGKSNVGVGVMVAVLVMVGVCVMVEVRVLVGGCVEVDVAVEVGVVVRVGVDVMVTVGVNVQRVAVAVRAFALRVACQFSIGVQALRKRTINKSIICFMEFP